MPSTARASAWAEQQMRFLTVRWPMVMGVKRCWKSGMAESLQGARAGTRGRGLADGAGFTREFSGNGAGFDRARAAGEAGDALAGEARAAQEAGRRGIGPSGL